ncbi:uncharacterized protein LOC114758972 isoform X1 [Neltuma alba]|uniref:uncharacterized protein LOC114758972 isoform X1 n=1 Tax=Neltuma alba TaxID=207710 RepID=UPI0010A423D4|nr:uncharacterized protein LOC114758972 isoform X1 [Prosopis alba]
MMFSSSPSSSSPTFTPPFSQVPRTLLIPPRNQPLPWKLPPTIPQSTPQQSIFTPASFLPCALSRNLHKCFVQRQSQSNEEKEQERDDQELEIERLFSNLNQATLKREPGSLSSAIFLVAGTTVGAGILAIPAVTQESGFLASAVVCILCWLFMVVTGLLIAEVNVNTMCELGSGGVSLLISGINGQENFRDSRSSNCMLVIHLHPLCPPCCICSSFFRYIDKFSWNSLMGKCYFVFIGFRRRMLFWKRFIGAVNGTLVLGIVSSFAALLAVASGELHWDALLKANFQAAPMSIPIIALSFVYQNVVPVLCSNLEGDLSKVRSAIVLGTGIPLALFLVWNAVILGTVGNNEVGMDPLEQLRSTNGIVGPIVEAFSLLAIATSYIGFVLGLSDFLADLLQFPSGQNKPLPFVLALVPPLVLSSLDPEIFFKALDFAGTYGVLVLFGIIPAAMSWSDRYSNSNSDSSPTVKLPELVPGGKITLLLVLGGAGYVVLSELLENFQSLQKI